MFGEMDSQCIIESKWRQEGQLETAGNFFKGILNPVKSIQNVMGGWMDGAQQGLWYPVYHPSQPGVPQGEVEIMLTLLPKKQAEERPVGKGREAPNRDPELQ